MTDSGYSITCFAPERRLLAKIMQKTHFRSNLMKPISLVIAKDYFNTRERVIRFYADLFLNGHKQTFIQGNSKYHLVSEPDNYYGHSFGDVLYNGIRDNRQRFIDNEYSRFMHLFSRNTASDIIIPGRNLIINKIRLMLEDQITPYKIIKYYSHEILRIQESHNIPSDEAIRVVKDLLINYYINYYLDRLYLSKSFTHDYVDQIRGTLLDQTSSTIFQHDQNELFPDFINEFELIFDISNYFNDKEIIELVSTSHFTYTRTHEHSDNFKPSWTLSIDSIFNELTEPILKTYDFLSDVLNNYPSNADYFSVHFHKFSVSGINDHSTLAQQTNSEEIIGTSFEIKRSDPQSIINGIVSIIYYMLKYNALVIIKDGPFHSSISETVILFDQIKVYEPILESLISSSGRKFTLSQHSQSNYGVWQSTYSRFFTDMYPIYGFHDAEAFGFRLVERLRLFRNINSEIFSLMS